MDEFLAVIVLYKTTIKECNTLISLQQACEYCNNTLDVVVYDNSPAYNEQQQTALYPNLTLIYKKDFHNSGVSTAYNFGHTIALQKGKKWLILFDQDTHLPKNSIKAYLNSIDQFDTELLFCPIMISHEKKIISPCNFVFMRGSYLNHIDCGINNFKGKSLINSGLCISVGAFSKNNGYNNLIKLDYSDHDFITRFAKNVTDKFVVLDLHVLHQLSTTYRNSLTEDKTRFLYYLDGAKHMSVSSLNLFFLKWVNFLRSIKLSMTHKNLYFIKAYFTCLF